VVEVVEREVSDEEFTHLVQSSERVAEVRSHDTPVRDHDPNVKSSGTNEEEVEQIEIEEKDKRSFEYSPNNRMDIAESPVEVDRKNSVEIGV
jgi:hypothetical protein